MGLDMFLSMTGIEGEAQDSKHKGEIQIESWSYSSKVGATRATGSAAIINDAEFTAVYSKASPKIMLACCSGTKITKAVFTSRKQGKEQEEFLKVTFNDVLISSYKVNGIHGQKGVIPTESFSINFSRINFEYRMQTQKGSLSGTVSSSYSVQKEQGQGQ